LTSSLGLIWYLANMLILLSLPLKLSYYQILCFLMLHVFVKVWVPFNISLLWDQIFAFFLLLTKSVSLCMLLQTHWAAVKRILHYLKGTTTHDLHITRSFSFALHGFTNIDWVGSIDEWKSIGGYLLFFYQTLISWKSSKQRTVARSSIKAEYKTLIDGTVEVIWLQYLLTDLQISSVSAPIIWCDNLGAIILVLLIYLWILFSMLAQNMLRLIIILSKI